MKKIIYYAAIVLLGTACTSGEEKTDMRTDEEFQELLSELEEIDNEPFIPESPKWQYSTSVDEMYEDSTHKAVLDPKNLIDLDFPYQGGSKVDITVRNSDGTNEVMLYLNKGQFAGTYTYDYVTVKFGSNKAKEYKIGESVSRSSSIRFINNSSQFIKELKSNDSLMMEVPLYNHGKAIYYYDVSDLKWNR